MGSDVKFGWSAPIVPAYYFVRADYYTYTPQPDITAYELAQILPIMVGNFQCDAIAFIEKLPPACQRHFRKSSGS